MDTAEVLPHVNAALNATSTVLLVAGYALIRGGHHALHRKVMLAAIVVSAVFLVSYLVYHFTAPIFVYQGPAWTKPFYFALLISHVVLAAVLPVLAVMTALRAFAAWRLRGGFAPGLFDRHKSTARWTLPVWLYVTVTGVMIYAILYHVYPNPA